MNLVLQMENVCMPEVYAIDLPLLQDFYVLQNIFWMKAHYQAVVLFHPHKSSFPELLLGIDLRNSHMTFSAICRKDGEEPSDLLKMQMGKIFLKFHHHSFILEIVIASLETAGLLLSILSVFISLALQILLLIAFPFLHRLLESSEPNLTKT